MPSSLFRLQLMLVFAETIIALNDQCYLHIPKGFLSKSATFFVGGIADVHRCLTLCSKAFTLYSFVCRSVMHSRGRNECILSKWNRYSRPHSFIRSTLFDTDYYEHVCTDKKVSNFTQGTPQRIVYFRPIRPYQSTYHQYPPHPVRPFTRPFVSDNNATANDLIFPVNSPYSEKDHRGINNANIQISSQSNNLNNSVIRHSARHAIPQYGQPSSNDKNFGTGSRSNPVVIENIIYGPVTSPEVLATITLSPTSVAAQPSLTTRYRTAKAATEVHASSPFTDVPHFPMEGRSNEMAESPEDPFSTLTGVRNEPPKERALQDGGNDRALKCFKKELNRTLVGFEQITLWSISAYECLTKCFHRRDFYCLSTNYNRLNGSCTLNGGSKGLNEAALSPAVAVDYFENTCSFDESFFSSSNTVGDVRYRENGLPNGKVHYNLTKLQECFAVRENAILYELHGFIVNEAKTLADCLLECGTARARHRSACYSVNFFKLSKKCFIHATATDVRELQYTTSCDFYLNSCHEADFNASVIREKSVDEDYYGGTEE